MEDNKYDGIIKILSFLILCCVSYILVSAFVYLAFICFDLTFTWKLSTGIWLCWMAVNLTLSGFKK